MDLVRREIKFQIPIEMVEPISKFVELYCDMDKYSTIEPDHFYIINSLYLDSDQMALLETKRINAPKRFSMRIRTYGVEPKFPAFIEVKKKVDIYINKRRAAINSWDTIDFIRDGVCKPDNPDIIHPFLRAPCYHILKQQLKPKMMTRYRRKAYMGRYDTYSRVTFDRDMSCYFENRYKIFPDESKFRNYDHHDQYRVRNNNVVLELKCEMKIPFWMNLLIRKFGLNQLQFSKFDSSWTYLTDISHEEVSFDSQSITS